ncbi:hypothetical protein OWV82_016509 [Melia azedarach]|uniref:Uncharacterized protein n=1 Tax=Melia azedarach TaxID=155640 RepID=A0ACC1XHF3_MELAZ|nr:hypothetical protein OWV82_016509 [Melia azedarach]
MLQTHQNFSTVDCHLTPLPPLNPPPPSVITTTIIIRWRSNPLSSSTNPPNPQLSSKPKTSQLLLHRQSLQPPPPLSILLHSWLPPPSSLDHDLILSLFPQLLLQTHKLRFLLNLVLICNLIRPEIETNLKMGEGKTTIMGKKK